MSSNNSSSTSLSVASPISPTSVAAAAAAMVSSSLYLPQTYSFLSPEILETLVEGYINQLHIHKRNQALINQQLANDCLMVLTNPENTAIFNLKFRWLVRKHFVFTVVGELRILMDKKNGKPVCVREQLYDKVCYFHHTIGHGGRDKTFAAVPAELVLLFTKNCQTCLGVRKYNKNKRPILNEFEYPGRQQTSAPQPHLNLNTVPPNNKNSTITMFSNSSRLRTTHICNLLATLPGWVITMVSTAANRCTV